MNNFLKIVGMVFTVSHAIQEAAADGKITLEEMLAIVKQMIDALGINVELDASSIQTTAETMTAK